MANIVDWLRNLGLSQYEAVFSHNEIDFSVLQDLTDADLRELGLPMGPRKKGCARLPNLKDRRTTSRLRRRPRLAATPNAVS